jgi:hypothetical protein
MKVGDLCKVTKRDTHRPCHYGDYVILLGPLGKSRVSGAKYWWVLNISKDTENHHSVDELEVVCK